MRNYDRTDINTMYSFYDYLIDEIIITSIDDYNHLIKNKQIGYYWKVNKEKYITYCLEHKYEYEVIEILT